MGWKDRANRLKTKAKKMQAEAKLKAPTLKKKVLRKLSNKQLEMMRDMICEEILRRQ